MPQQIWKHTCTDGSIRYSFFPRDCDCGQPDEYAGYHYNSMERKAWYQKLYGLAPEGPHRRLADDLFSKITETCPECAGEGILNDPMWIGFLVCSRCGGAGKLWKVTDAERQAVRTRILAQFPLAAADDQIADPMLGVIIQDRKTGAVQVITDFDDLG